MIRNGTLMLLFLSLMLGCRGEKISTPKANPVSGSVVSKGKGVAGIRVTLHPQFNMTPVKLTPTGETNAEGKFVLTTGATDNGAPPGSYIVTLTKPIVVSDVKNSGIETEVDALQGKYSDPEKSTKTVTIKKGEAILAPIEID